MLKVRSEAKDGTADIKGAVDPRSTHHHATLLLQMLQEALCERIRIAVPGDIAERDHRKVRRGTRIEALDLRQAPMKKAGQSQGTPLRWWDEKTSNDSNAS
jgi:hypothetical protein